MASRTRSGERAAAAETRRGAVRSSRVLRGLIAHEHRTAAGLFALLVVAYLWPVLLAGKTLAPTALLYVLTPWQEVAPHDFGSYLNLELGDVPFTYYPWNVLARELIHAGTFPAWNPYAFGGTPFFANVEVAWLSPFSLPLWLLPLHYGLGLAATLKLWVAGFGTYLLARELNLGFWAGVLAGISFALCAFDVVWLAHSVHVSVAALLPWMLWLVERIVRRGRSIDGLALAAVVAVVLTGGHPGTQLHVLAGAALYALVRTGVNGDVEWRERLRRLALVGTATIIGTLLAAVVLVSAQQAAIDTVGEDIRRNGGLAFPGARMNVDVLRTALFPDWWGRPGDELVAGPANYKERTFYAGSVALVLAVLALVSAGGWRRKAPFALLGAIGLAVPVHAPGIYQLVTHMPLFSQVQNQRILLWFLLAVAILAGFGLQTMLDAEMPERHLWGVLGAAFLVGLIAVAGLHVESRQWGQALDYVLRRSGQPGSTVTALASVGWWLLLVAVLAPFLILLCRRPRRVALLGGMVVLFAALDMLHFAHGYQPIGPADQIVPAQTPAVRFLEHHATESRIAGTGLTFAADWSTVYHLRDARGRDAPQPSLRFARLWGAIGPTSGSFTLPDLDVVNPRALGVLGARYLVADAGTRTSTAGLTPVYRGPDATIFSNAFAMPRAIVAANVHVAGDEDEELAAIGTAEFDPRRDAVVRRDELGNATAQSAGDGEVRVVSERNAEVTLRARLRRAGLVVLDDTWAPGWTVEVDGRPARALQTDLVLRGVLVPEGTHEIVWRYRVPGLRLGAGLSMIGLLAVLFWAAWLVRAEPRPAPARWRPRVALLSRRRAPRSRARRAPRGRPRRRGSRV